MPRECRRVVYSGRVQGVGFRQTAWRLAQGYPVAGRVKNLPDGRVELVAEGDSADVSAFLGAVQDRLGDHIRDVESETGAGTDGDTFTIEFD